MVSLLCVVFFFVGLSLTALGFATASQTRRRSGWPVAQGTVASGEVLEIDAHFTGVVRYRYALRPGTAYRGGSDASMEGRFESPPCPDRGQAEAHVLRYPVGERIDVRYDPAHPTRSTLGDPPRTSFPWWLGLFGLSISIASAAVALVP